MGTQKSDDNVYKKLKYISVVFDRADKTEVYHHLNLNHKVSDFIIASDLDNDRIIGEIFTPLYTKVTTLSPRFLKLASGNQGRVLVDDNALFVEDIMSTDPFYLVKGYRYKPSNAKLPSFNESASIPTKDEILNTILKGCGDLTRTMNPDPRDSSAEETETLREKEETIDKLERELRARDVIIERLGEEFNDEMRKKKNEISNLKEEHEGVIARLKEEHNAEVVSMGLEISEKDAMIEKLKGELEALKNQGVASVPDPTSSSSSSSSEGVPVKR